jgi:formamidopyrimidine-DNA glycosylase
MSGMSIEEAKAYLRERDKEGVFGLTWEELRHKLRSGKITVNAQKMRMNGRKCVRCGNPVKKDSLLCRCPNCQV